MRKGWGIGCSLVCVLIALFYFFYPWHTLLAITATKQGNVILCAEMAEGEEFILSFVHSVNMRPVYDTLRIEGDHLLIIKSRYDSFGAGMPETSTGASQLNLRKDGWLEWSVNRPVPEILLFVGWVADHSLSMKGRKLALTDLVEPGTSVSIKTRRASFFEIWKGRCLR